MALGSLWRFCLSLLAPLSSYLFLCTSYSAVYLLERAQWIGPQINLTQSNRLLCANIICRSIAPWGGGNAQSGPIRSSPVQKLVQCCFPYSGMQAGWCKLRCYMGGTSVMNQCTLVSKMQLSHSEVSRCHTQGSVQTSVLLSL